MMEKKTPMRWFDKKGNEIKEFAIIKIFYFIGYRNKKHYMYKWVKIKDGCLVAYHLVNDSNGYFDMRSYPQYKKLEEIEIVQYYE